MPISVVCPGCKTRFEVSEKYAGKTGPCPKCKQTIKVPEVAVQAVTIHEPEAPAGKSSASGRPPTAPIRRIEKPIAALAIAGTVGAIVLGLLLSLLSGWVYKQETPPGMLLAGAFFAAVPCVLAGYTAVRPRELEPYTGRALLLRALICAAVYTILWAGRGLLPHEASAEMWQWLYLGPMFVTCGTMAAIATLDLELGAAVGHYGFYVVVTACMRWLAGLSPL